MRPTTIALTLALGGAPALAAAVAAPAALAQGKPAFSVGQQVEILDAQENRWYQARVDKYDKKAAKYTVLILGLNEKAVVEEAKLRPQGGGEVVDLKFIEARNTFRMRRMELDKAMKGAAWNNPASAKEVRDLHAALSAMLADMQAKWPKENLAPAVDWVAKAKAEIDAKAGAAEGAAAAGAAAGDKAKTDADALAARYEPLSKAAQGCPREVSAELMVDRAEMLEALDFAAIDAMVAADAKAHPEVFKYYGSEEKGRYADLAYGGSKRPQFAAKGLEQVNTYYVKEIFQAKARLAAGEAELARAVSLALDAAQRLEEAQKAVRLAHAVKKCRPGTPGIDGLVAKAEARRKEIESAPPPAAPAPAAPSAPARPERTMDLSKISSGVELTFSTSADPAAPRATSFAPGASIYAHAKFPGPILNSTGLVVSEQTFFNLTFLRDGKNIGNAMVTVRFVHLQGEQGANRAGAIIVPVISDPAQDCRVYGNNCFNLMTWEDLSALPPGEHELVAVLEAQFPKVEGVPLAAAKVKIAVTPEGAAKWKGDIPALTKATADRGGEIVVVGLRAEGPKGWKISCQGDSVSTTTGAGKFEKKDFVSGLALLGKRGIDSYSPGNNSGTIYVKRGEGGYDITQGGKTLARILHDQTILDRDGKPWGKVTNEWEKVSGGSDLVTMVAGLYHWSDLLR